MQHKNPELFDKIIRFVNDFYQERMYTPSVRDIAAGLGISKSTAASYLAELRERGRIDYDNRVIITEQMADQRFGHVSRVRMLGHVPCGSLTLEEQEGQEYMNFPAAMLGPGRFFMLKAYGDSMTGAGIDPGDDLIVRRQTSANNGDLAVVYVEGEGSTLKRYLLDDRNHRIILHPENPKYEDIVVQDCVVQGVVRKIIKNVPSSTWSPG